MQCNAMTKANQPCVYAAKENGYCGVHKHWADTPTVPEQDDMPEQMANLIDALKAGYQPHEFDNSIYPPYQNDDGRHCHICGYKEGEWPHVKQIMVANSVTNENEVVAAEVAASGGLRPADTVVNQTAVNNNKEEEMDDVSYIYHFLMEKVEEGEVILPRIFTNHPLESEADRYVRSVSSKKPVDGLLAINSGNYKPHLLQWLLADKGYKFRMMILSNKETKDLDPSVLQKWHGASNFSFANDSHTFFLRIEGVDEWGLDVMGLTALDVPKIQKRLGELAKVTEMAWFSKDSKKLSRMMVNPVGMPVAYIDGMNYISKRMALRCINTISDRRRRRSLQRALLNEEMVRFNIRVMTPDGLIKGDAEVSDKMAMGFDLVYPEENLKREFFTNGWVSVTLEKHQPHHIAVWDDQTWINNRSVLTEEKQKQDLAVMVANIRESLAKGEVPDWLLKGEEVHDDSGVPNFERLSELMDRQYVKWNVHGLDIRGAQNLVYMAINGILKRMEREIRRVPFTYYRKTWTMMTNAYLAAVNTYESMGAIGKINLTDANGGYIHFDARYGLIMSGERFIGTYKLHGGWDLDDTVKVILIKVFSSDAAKTKRLLESGAMDPRCVVRTTAEEATPVAFLVRSPNGPGEYSIEALNPDTWRDMPWHKFNEDTIPVVDLAHITEPQPVLLENVTVRGIPTSVDYTREALSADRSIGMIMAQMVNPGIGRICNSLMNMAMSLGPCFPDEMVGLLEQMVDTTQQVSDVVSFEAIDEEVNNFYEQMVDHVVANNAPVDRLLGVAHPIPEKFAKQMKGHMVTGRFTRYNNLYAATIKELRNEILMQSLQMRNTTPVVAWARSLRVSDETITWAKDFEFRYGTELDINAYTWRTNAMEEKNPFAKMHFEVMRTQANKETVAKMVAELRAFGGLETFKRVLSLWHTVLIPKSKKDSMDRKGHKAQPMGSSDRIIFQPGDEESVMDILIEALIWQDHAVEYTEGERS